MKMGADGSRGSTRMLPGNQIELLQSGAEFFPALTAAIDAASAYIRLETYIFADDPVGRSVREHLARAAARGVQVSVVVDGFGSGNLPTDWWQNLIHAGGELRIYRPGARAWKFRRSQFRRLHRKLAVIDGQTAFVGGINIEDDWNVPGQTAPRLDFAVRLQGPLVFRVSAAMEKLRLQLGGTSSYVCAESEAAPLGIRAALLLRDNFRHRREIERAYLNVIDGANREIFIACAYFFPGIRFRQALTRAARRGVEVILLLQGMTDYRIQRAATRALYGTLLDAGVNIYEYQASELHAKVAVVDGHWSTVGSSNIDPLSLLLAREANVVVEDIAFASELRQRLEQSLSRGFDKIEHATWKSQPWHVRFRSWLAYGLMRWVLGPLVIPGKW